MPTTIDRATRIFFDASSLVAADGSPSGGSSFLISVCARGYLRGVASLPVMMEAERNIRAKLSSAALFRYHRILTETPLVLSPVPPSSTRAGFTAVAAEDDHVIAACLVVRAEFLITLDRTLLERLDGAKLPFRAMMPGAFIKEILIAHIDYPSMR